MKATTDTTTTTTDPEAALAEIMRQPAAELELLQSFLADCELRKESPDPAISIPAELEAERAEIRLSEYANVPIEIRAIRLADEWVVDNLAELVALLRDKHAERAKGKDGFLQAIGKKVSAISLEMFAPSRDRDALAREREIAEDEADALEATIQSAAYSIRRLEIEPSLAAYREADAAVNRVKIS